MKTKSKSLWVLLALIFVFTFAGNVSAGDGWSDNETEPCTIMKPDRETLQRWIKDYESAPMAYIDEELALTIQPKGSYSLLSHLQYIPAERNQGSCGNCWAWAGTGVMGIALDVEEGILDRLSVQYLNSCKAGSYACCGGWLSDVATFYTSNPQAIPWSNTSASWADGSRTCFDGSSLVPCGSISTSPYYPVALINEQTIPTHLVGQAQAIANIKNVLNQDKAVWFGYFLATGDDWNNFGAFWWSQPESVTWNPDFSCDHTWDDGGGHAVLCVGYNDDDPNNSYWIMVNSWGTAGGGRPNGIFRLDMNMNYDCAFFDAGWWYSFYWQTLDINYDLGWEIAYNSLFDSPSDLELLRQYRDEFLTKTTKGTLYTRLLYKRSEKALQVLLQNPELMMEAKHLIEANKGAVSGVLNGYAGVIYNTDEIVSFLKAYARKSPPGLKLLANTIKLKILTKQMQDKPFLGFTLK